jgi:hypothetical protein
MFTATYPASFLPEEGSQGFYVRFPDLPEALTGGTDLRDTQEQAVDCLASAFNMLPKRTTRTTFPEKYGSRLTCSTRSMNRANALSAVTLVTGLAAVAAE